MKLTYTSEMVKQDELWKSEKENLKIMEKLQLDVINEAKQKGFKGLVITYNCSDDEIISEVYSNKEELDKAQLGELDFAGENAVGNCKSLIEKIESYHLLKK